nr:protein NUCLEAR FUSION DEFECTIVE 6, chloroplastic/mitochondrial-like [Ipomoea trifida]
MAAIAAKSVFCSAALCARAAATSSVRTAATRAAAGAKRRTSASPFAIPTQRPLTSRIFRSPVELSCVRVDTMLPYHTATASALLNSMLSVAPRCYGWTLEVIHGGVDLHAREKGGGVLAIQHFSAELIGLGVDEGQLVGEILRENRLRYSHADVSDADDGDFGVTLGRRQQRRVLYRLEEGLA